MARVLASSPSVTNLRQQPMAFAKPGAWSPSTSFSLSSSSLVLSATSPDERRPSLLAGHASGQLSGNRRGRVHEALRPRVRAELSVFRHLDWLELGKGHVRSAANGTDRPGSAGQRSKYLNVCSITRAYDATYRQVERRSVAIEQAKGTGAPPRASLAVTPPLEVAGDRSRTL